MAVQSAWTPELREWLGLAASEAGFNHAGVAAVEGVTEPVERLDAQRFAEWIEAGRAGEMEYLKRRDDAGALLRESVQIPMPWARSVVVCAMNYNAAGPQSVEPARSTTGWIARYAWSGRPHPEAVEDDGGMVGADYHTDLLERLGRLETELRARTGCASRSYVDTGPFVERSLAARAGVGWIGKNTCVLNQRTGSFLLLGTIVTSLPLPPRWTLEPAADRCGSCTRCLDACPTEALVAPRQMDARRCIAYLTIEKKGAIAEDLRPVMGRQVFGCDICQEVCPWNRRAPVATEQQVRVREQMINPDLGWLAAMDAPAFRRWFKGSPLERTKRGRLHRNVAIAMGNSREQQFIPQLTAWSEGEDPVLAEAATWALRQIRAGSAADAPALPDE